MGVGDITSFVTGGLGVGGFFGILISIFVIAIPTGLVIIGIFYFFYKKRKWNLNVEIKIPRGLKNLKEGEEIDPDKIEGIINAEWGKGSYNTKKGVCFVKRKKRKASPMHPFDIKRYVQGNGILTVVQTGADKYAPVIPESFLQMVDDESGEEAALLKIKMDNSEDTAWRDSFEREAKATYSIMGLLMAYKDYIGWSMILFANFIGFAILYSKIT